MRSVLIRDVLARDEKHVTAYWYYSLYILSLDAEILSAFEEASVHGS